MEKDVQKLLSLGFVETDAERFSKCDDNICITIDIYTNSGILYVVSKYNYYTEEETKKIYKTFASVLNFLQKHC